LYTLFELKNAKENLELHHGLRGTGWPTKIVRVSPKVGQLFTS